MVGKARGRTYICKWQHSPGAEICRGCKHGTACCGGHFLIPPAGPADEANGRWHCYATPPRTPAGVLLPDELLQPAGSPTAVLPPPPAELALVAPPAPPTLRRGPANTARPQRGAGATPPGLALQPDPPNLRAPRALVRDAAARPPRRAATASPPCYNRLPAVRPLFVLFDDCAVRPPPPAGSNTVPCPCGPTAQVAAPDFTEAYYTARMRSWAPPPPPADRPVRVGGGYVAHNSASAGGSGAASDSDGAHCAKPPLCPSPLSRLFLASLSPLSPASRLSRRSRRSRRSRCPPLTLSHSLTGIACRAQTQSWPQRTPSTTTNPTASTAPGRSALARPRRCRRPGSSRRRSNGRTGCTIVSSPITTWAGRKSGSGTSRGETAGIGMERQAFLVVREHGAAGVCLCENKERQAFSCARMWRGRSFLVREQGEAGVSLFSNRGRFPRPSNTVPAHPGWTSPNTSSSRWPG